MRKVSDPGLIHNEPTDVFDFLDCSEMNNPHDRQQDYGISTTMGERLEKLPRSNEGPQTAFGV